MKKIAMVLALVAATLGIQQASAMIVVKFDPATTSVTVGSEFSVNVLADIPDDEGLVAWGFSLEFDDGQMQLQQVVAGPGWDLVFAPTTTTPLDPLVALILPTGSSPDDGVIGSNVFLGTLTFDCLAEGNSVLDIAVADLTADPTQGFMTAAGNYATWSSVEATILQTPSGIPEPAGILLLLTGLAAIAGVRRGRSGSQA